ncbi:hypothetical protein [Reichenbachiella sp.]|uniref:hypothetical protein n=1 Tax=Reichenbachiella sp. TaxID=2184521 RepID=UPI003B5A7B7B
MEKFNKRLTKSLVETGNLVPSTIEEIKIYLKSNKIEQLPEQFELNIDSKSKRAEYKNNNHHENYSGTEENLAQAAREGREVPADIKKKMENDRKNSNPEI